MFKQKISKHGSIRFKKKLFLKQLTGKKIKNIYKIRCFLTFLIIFLTCCVIGLFLSIINYYLKIIIIYSIIGFLTFFMAYFGWILANFIMDKMNDKKQISINNVLHYFKKLKKIIINKN
jgi:hypothetical protein